MVSHLGKLLQLLRVASLLSAASVNLDIVAVSQIEHSAAET